MEFNMEWVCILFIIGEIFVPGDGIKKGVFQNNTLIHIEEESNLNSIQ